MNKVFNDSEIEQIAKVCHNVNKTFCERIGDTSQPTWEDAPQWQKDSAIMGVKYHLKNPNSKPSDSHESWFSQKVNEGWIYGTIKDPIKKEHPCMVEYSKLPFDQQTKDYLFVSVVRSFE